MEDILKDDEFSQFILKYYYNDISMANEEKIEQVSSSVEEFWLKQSVSVEV